MILRRLFHVHAALADFDLALRALDSYIEIVTNAKSRAEKSAQYGELENDGTLIQTVSEGVTMLCCFGSLEEAEKARDLTDLLKEYMDKHAQNIQGSRSDQENGESLIHQNISSAESEAVCPRTISTAYRAIGVGLANWASWTPVNESRDDIRAEAIEYLERSLDPELEDSLNFSSLYTLALLLAENRDLDAAIKCAKLALASNTNNSTSQPILSRERDTVPLWHLLSLLLSAKQDFEIAERSCEAVFEQFPNAASSHSHSEKRSYKPVQNGNNPAVLQHALVGQLRGREKERIIETRITQIAFVELSEGPEAAVNRSDHLLGLFATLFPNLILEEEEKTTKADSLTPPKSSAGTVRSFRSSIFGRQRSTRAPDRKAEVNNVKTTADQLDSNVQRDQANTADAPSIQVTEEDGISVEDPQQSRLKLQKRGGSVKKSENPQAQQPQLTNGEPETSAPTAQQPDMVGVAVSDTAVTTPANQQQTGKQPLRPIAHNIKHTRQPAPTGHSKQPPEQDVRLPICYRFDSPTNAVTRFSTTEVQKHALCILVKIWLLIAGLYRRASLFDDAREACEEASKHVSRVEALVAAQECSARAFRTRGWGCGKSCDELWADLFTERGLLSKAQSRPHEAMEHFEEALTRYLDHPKATIVLADLLLDIWDKKIPSEPAQEDVDVNASMQSLLAETLNNQNKALNKARSKSRDTKEDLSKPQNNQPRWASNEEPRYLNQLAARDRAYGLLSALTKRGSSWDNSEAWYVLGRAYEAGGQINKLREVLWWCIELEDRRPIRHWSNIGSGLYVL